MSPLLLVCAAIMATGCAAMVVLADQEEVITPLEDMPKMAHAIAALFGCGAFVMMVLGLTLEG